MRTALMFLLLALLGLAVGTELVNMASSINRSLLNKSLDIERE